MFELILSFYFAYKNSVRAKAKGLNAFLWAAVTMVSFFVAFSIGCMVVVYGFFNKVVDLSLLSSDDPEVRMAITKQFVELFSANPLHIITIDVFAIGGYLLIRFLLERKPEKKEVKVHWMDKLGENREGE